ncbi:hypothetical protein MATL_G00105290 [Megalops atlanticus]|uniref:Ig-like domain-containing protein n=1 Tax=Megalops atlanticus TaxID=7932 RepID=A0A9D3T699_MEGAT|nr:hypothetical protein MATL_G00105290 [Megalops atlanticus]
MYKLYRDGKELPVDKADSSSGNGDTFTILSANQSHNGTYTCRGELTRRAVYSVLSSPVALRLHDKIPKPVITQQPLFGEIYTGERVTLSCGFGGDPAGWEYLWYKDTQGAALPNTDSSRTDGSSYTISSAALSHSGKYWCQAGRGRELFQSQCSDSLMLNISAHSQAVLILATGWTEIFTTDSLTLRCEIQGISAEWNYTWYRDGEQIPLDHTRDRYTVRSGNGSYQSEYKCRGNRKKRPLFSNISKGLTPNTIRFYYFLGLSGALVMLITIVVLEVICVKKFRKSGQSKKQLNKDKFYSKVNPEYVSSDHTLLSDAIYEEIEDTTEKQGSQAQASVHSVIQLENLDKGPSM